MFAFRTQLSSESVVRRREVRVFFAARVAETTSSGEDEKLINILASFAAYAVANILWAETHRNYLIDIIKKRFSWAREKNG